ncbi:MAG: hypothetical protein LZF61_03675 [Nitrosomonas sp.]|nr:MAG: hypothetical protein LZF61_03675 [Nitrosomonas sp.]
MKYHQAMAASNTAAIVLGLDKLAGFPVLWRRRNVQQTCRQTANADQDIERFTWVRAFDCRVIDNHLAVFISFGFWLNGIAQ